MAITLKRSISKEDTDAAVRRLQELARDSAERLGPYAAEARETAADRLHQARGWTAPRLETAAHRVEDTVAPKVAELLTTAARRIDPSPPAAVLRGRRRRRALLVVGLGVLGAAAVYGVIRLSQASADAEWQESLQQAREQVREAKEKVVARARGAQGEANPGEDGEAADSDAAKEMNGRVRS